MDDLSRTIDCPVPWCVGSVLDHGGLGDLPEDWVHTDGDGIEVAPGWRLGRTQTAAGDNTWHLAVEHVDVLRADSLDALSAQLAGVALAVMEAGR